MDLQYRGKSFIQFPSPYRPLHAQSLPINEDTLIQYVAYLAKSVKHSTIKGYLAAVRHFHIRHGYQLNLRKFLRLHLVCRGIKRSQGSSTKNSFASYSIPPQIFLLPSSNQVHFKLWLSNDLGCHDVTPNLALMLILHLLILSFIHPSPIPLIF